MKSELKQLPKSEVELTITVPYGIYQKWEKKALEDIRKEMKVDGFRRGHVPEAMVRAQIEEEVIKATTLDYLLPDTYFQAVCEHHLPVIATPEVDIQSTIKNEGDDLVYVAKVAVFPDAKVGDYKKIKVAKKPVKIEKKNIDETIDMIMDRYAEWCDVDRVAKKGDRVEVTFEGFDEKNEALPNTASKNHPVILGSHSMVPGFEEAILEMAKDETKEFTVTFPKDYHAESMRNKKVTFQLTLNRVEGKKAQVLDASMVEKITQKKQSVDEFKALIEDGLKEEMEARQKQDHENAIIQEIIEITTLDLPEALVLTELNHMMDEQKDRLKQQGISWDQFLQHTKKTEDDFIKDYRQVAEDRLYARLGIQFIMKDADIKVEDKEVADRLHDILARYPESEHKEIKDYYKKEGEGYLMLENSIASDKLFAFFTL